MSSLLFGSLLFLESEFCRLCLFALLLCFEFHLLLLCRSFSLASHCYVLLPGSLLTHLLQGSIIIDTCTMGQAAAESRAAGQMTDMLLRYQLGKLGVAQHQ